MSRLSVYDISQEQFFQELDDMGVDPEDVFKNAPRIYEYMAELFGEECDDSILREQIFQWWAESTKLPYTMIYDHWLDKTPIGAKFSLNNRKNKID